ncbi:zinc finger protein 418-like [Branchiostoma lanceolatum]|uniref:zinc finger protein 418-like n=1 Tax=Branchiostoma lanceolatum TaxID=7740 RepID=UPI0034519D82
MSRQQELICGLSRVVTIAVLPRLNMEELIFELNRRIQNLDKENSIKDRLVSILRDVMLEEYSQLERESEVSSPDGITIPEQEQETVTMQENISTVNADTMSTKTPSPEVSLQCPGLEIVIKKESCDERSEVHMLTNVLDLDSDQLQLTQQDQLCNIPNSSWATPPSADNPLIQMINSVNSRIKEDFDMTAGDETARACHAEINIDTPTVYTQVLDACAINPMSDSRTEKHLEGHTNYEEKPSCELTLDHRDVRRWKCHVSDNDQAKQICQPSKQNHPERYSDDRETGFINSGQEQSENTGSEETSLAACQPNPDQACEKMASPLHDNDSRIDCKRFVCDVCGFKTVSASSFSKHRQRHTGEKPFMCGECGYRAYAKHRLVGHMRKHTGEKPFKCNQCDYKTSHRSGLDQHMKIHAGVKPYKCGDCGYRTAHKPSLIRHRRLHSGERPYSCQECAYKAREKGNLLKHMRNKHQ